ncbi:class I SAM-dependent methyltransferase [Pseudooceanicola sp. MF1-13]|uniref:class I SAM-dependent methyltransferase n=1 Tax=Pseudooceanicola sp. MF1-13 TaxID=3379095 RepID=UPI0038919095
MQSQSFWDKVAPSYAKRPIENLPQHERTVERSASYLTPTSDVLEVGCGTGTIAFKLAPHARSVLATDISGALLDIARDRAKDQDVDNVTFAQHDIARMPDGQFDAVMAFNVLHLIPAMDKAVREMADRLKPGGVLVTKTGVLAGTWQGQLLRPVIGAMRLVGKAPFVAFLKPAEVIASMEAAGLEIVEAEKMGGAVGVQYLVARKPA